MFMCNSRLKEMIRAGLAFALALPFVVGCASIPPAPVPAAPPPTSATAGTTTIVAIAPPAAPAGPPCNLLDFLGITTICKGIGMEVTKIGGCLPNLIPGINGLGLGEFANLPPVLPINDPQNLKSSNPAVAAAAAAMRDEDAAPQKIAALNYLASRGCSSCVPGAEEALLSGLDDCTESVRFAAAAALYDAAGRPCRSCKAGNCCSPKIRLKLWELGYKHDEMRNNCPIEPSPRVRRQCRLALLACGCDCDCFPPDLAAPTPLEGPDASPDNVPLPPEPGITQANRNLN